MNDIAVAIVLLKRHQHLPLDLAAKLLAQGIDVTALEKKYGA